MLTLALASDDGRTGCRKRCSDPHEVETLSAAVRGGSEVDECDRILSVVIYDTRRNGYGPLQVYGILVRDD